MNLSDFGFPPSQPLRAFPDICVDGRRPNLWFLIPNGIVLGILAIELHPGAENLLIVGLIALIAITSLVQIAKFLRPPRLAISGGQFAFRYGFRKFRCPAADMADIHLQNRYLLLTLSDAQGVEPASMRERMANSYRFRGFHYFLPPGVYSLEQVNELRTALGMPPQASDRGGDEIDEFHDSIRSQRPLATQGLIAACVVVFVVKAFRDHSLMGGTLASDVAWGANCGPLTLGGQWWRLLTHQFLHGGIIHLGMNMYVFWIVGRLMERLVGRTALVLIFLLSGIGGGLASIGFHPNVVSVGASGAIFGIIGAMFGLLLHDRQCVPPARLRELRNGIIAFVVLNLIFGLSIAGIDMAAHVGGALTGLVIGLAIVPLQRPGHHLRCALLAIGGAVAVMLALHFMRAPFDPDQFYHRQDEIIATLKDLEERQERGDLDAEKFADKVDAEVVTPWRELNKDMNVIKSWPPDPQHRAKLLRYLQVRQECYEDLVAAIRTQNPELKDRSEAKGTEASNIAKELNSRGDTDQKPPE